MLTLPQALTQTQATACLAALVVELEGELKTGLKNQAQAVLLDASRLVSFDSAALALILELQRRCQALGKRLHIQGLPAQMTNLATLYGIEALLVSA